MSATAPPKLPPGASLKVAYEVEVGSVIDGKYRLDSVLGRGGMAVVFSATHVALGHAVAIKLLKPRHDGVGQAERIVREARAQAGLVSENVARVLDMGTLDSGEPYIVMERLVGKDVARVLRERGALPVDVAAGYLVQACDAIVEAHAKGIVHRDLKPSNLFLTTRRDGTALVKLMDFGISKVLSEGRDVSLTNTDDSLGTPHYMSPEQLMTSRDVDARTDVWALGVILYEMLAGTRPFTGETIPAIHVAVANAEAPRLRDARPDAPDALDELVARCLVKARERRLPSARAFAAALMPFVGDDTRKLYPATRWVPTDGASDAGNAPSDTTRDGASPDTHAAWGKAGAKSSRDGRRSALWMAAALLVAGGLVLSWRFVHPGTAALLGAGASASGGSPSAVPVTVASLPTEPDTAQSARPGPTSPSVAGSGAPPAHEVHAPRAATPGPTSPRLRPRPVVSASLPLAAPAPDPYGQRR